MAASGHNIGQRATTRCVAQALADSDTPADAERLGASLGPSELGLRRRRRDAPLVATSTTARPLHRQPALPSSRYFCYATEEESGGQRDGGFPLLL